MSDDVSGSARAEHGLQGAEQTVASFEEPDAGFVRRVQGFLHQYPTSIPFIVLLLGVVIFAIAAPGKFLSPLNLSVVIQADNAVSQPNALAGGQTAGVQNAQVSINKEPGKVMLLKGGASLAEVVKALNAIGATPQDLLAILQAMKAAGSLRAELEVI